MSATSAGPVAAVDTACAHCGLPVPEGRLPRDESRAFCCTGCDTAWQVLHAAGLEHYYELSRRRERAVEASGLTFDEFDHVAFRERYVRTRRDGLEETDLYLEGVHCPSCVWLVERIPTALPGMASAELDLARGRVRVAWDPEQTPLSAVARFLDTLGYRPHPFRGGRADERRRKEDRAMLVRIGVSGALAANTMLAALALYSGWFSGMEQDWARYFRIVSLLLVTPALFGPGAVFLRGAWGAWRARMLHMDVPIAIALMAAYVRGVVNTFTDHGPVYFDGVAMLVFLLLVGRFLQQRAARSAADSAELLYGLSPANARVRDADGVRDVPSEALLPGMEVEVRSGETVPADGVVIEGTSALDASWLTGESRPRSVAPGDAVHAGTVCRGATLVLRIERSGEDTRLAHILREVERGTSRRAPVVRVADRLAARFVVVVLALAVLTWVGWHFVAPADAFDHAIALLIITCPCALALATPLAVTVAIGRAARSGVLVKGGDTLESLAVPGTLVLDKTGTLTEGRPALLVWTGDEALRGAVLALERHATHPVALAFAEAWPGVEAAEAEDVRVELGAGVSGRVQGRLVRVGSPAWIARHTSRTAPNVGAEPSDALTPVWVAIDDTVVAHAGFGDRIRPEAAATLARLRAEGWRLQLLSGDEPRVVQATGRELGFAPEDVHGGVGPEDKRIAIESLSRKGRVVMVGDGVNDAAAIAVATVGVGVSGGAEACLAAADVYLSRPGIAALAALTQGARRTLATIRNGLGLSLVWNVAGAGLAMAGLVNPLVAAVAMPLSSVCVVVLAWRARTFTPEGA
ncbi:MAG: cadmium-translocating P-type ATPase [Gemmatimonadetes bacterium]|nr:cadmium-translocating P-type ATPase [Gemmatimonadota bacterium]